MATDLGSSFHEQYMAINTKLKKRFMRKPNISEATNEFIALAIQCENAEQPAFAGQCYVGAAKCEATAGNFLGEAEQYLAAARQYMKAEKKLKQLKFYSPDRENLEAAIGCYMQALPKYPEKSPIRTSILMELAEHLIFLNHKKEALTYYEQALQLVEDKFRRLMHMRTVLNLQMDCELFDQALETANKICEEHSNMPETLLSEELIWLARKVTYDSDKTLRVPPCQERRKPKRDSRSLARGHSFAYRRSNRIVLAAKLFAVKERSKIHMLQVSRILLALHVDPTEEEKPASLIQLFKDVTSEVDNVLPFNTDLHLKLQSLVLCCVTADIPSLISVSVDLKQHLTIQQVNLLDQLVKSKQMEHLSLGCAKGCSRKTCSCRKIGVPCSSLCKKCEGNNCANFEAKDLAETEDNKDDNSTK